MSVLVGYGASDDEEYFYKAIERIPASSPESSPHTFLTKPDSTNAEGDGVQELAQEAKEMQNTLVGPQVQPANSSNSEDGWTSPLSPYSANRAATRNLTMPLLPDLNIPPSPPDSPPPGVEEKFERFLQLKSQGVHFNEKLAGSSALKNPMLLQKLMASAGLSESDQYATTLPEDLWDPSAFPKHAYKEELARSQQKTAKRKEEQNLPTQREKVEFVPAINTEGSVRGNGTASHVGGERLTSGMNHLPQAWGRPRDDIYGPYDSSYLHANGPKAHTSSPIVTGTSVLAVKFKDGVVIAADNLASYGSLSRFTDVKRLRIFNRKTVVGFGGDVSDMQYLDRLLLSLDIDENYGSSGHDLNAQNLHTYLAKVMYKRRSDINPLWNHILVAGLDSEEQPFLSSVDLLGTTFSSPTLATGFGAHLAQPLLRKLADDEAAVQSVTREQAVTAIKECMKVLFYRDARSLDKYSIAVITKEGVELKENEQLEGQSWAFAEMIKGYGTQSV
ncbi:MAG: hypothetical protein Q9196_000500 [Gyalolechia fulgens]